MEGFGLTALEAMMCGTPVIASARDALPEVIANPELMFDPRNSQDIADRISRIFRDGDFARAGRRERTGASRAIHVEKIGRVSGECVDRNRPSSRQGRESEPEVIPRSDVRGIAHLRCSEKFYCRDFGPSGTVGYVIGTLIGRRFIYNSDRSRYRDSTRNQTDHPQSLAPRR